MNNPIKITLAQPEDPSSEEEIKLSENLTTKISNFSNQKKIKNNLI